VGRAKFIFLHPSDELYGADRILLELTAAVPPGPDVEVWVPTDLVHSAHPLCRVLEQRGILVQHADLPILRRAYRSPLALAQLSVRCLKLFWLLLRARPRVVYCTTSATFLAAPIARLARVPRVIGHVQEVWSRSDRRRLAVLAHACHQLITASMAALAPLPPALAARGTVVANATPDPGPVAPIDRRPGLLQVVVASRWTPRKGYATLLSAWDRLGEPGRLTILGGPPATGPSIDVAAMVAALRHPESVRIVGETDDVGPHVEVADVAVIPSDEPESFGLVAIEAFARARPVIASAGGGLVEIVTAGRTGWLFSPGDVDELTRLLERLSRDQLADAGECARIAYEQSYTSAAYRQRWNAALNDAAGSRDIAKKRNVGFVLRNARKKVPHGG
jgi:glycosyltransferase involved in cell wall biosynthesis